MCTCAVSIPLGHTDINVQQDRDKTPLACSPDSLVLDCSINICSAATWRCDAASDSASVDLYAHFDSIASSAAELLMQLLGLPDELLSEILKHVDVKSKTQHVQRCCMRFRRLLEQPIAPGVWGSVGARVVNDQASEISRLTALLQWLITRQTGDGSGDVSRSGCPL